LSCVGLLLAIGCRPAEPPAAEPPAAEPAEGAHGEEVVLTDTNFLDRVLASDKPVLVDFYTTWCPPCKQMAPIVAELAVEYEGRVVVGKVDVDENTRLGNEYEIKAIPTFIVFNEGKAVGRVVGSATKERLAGILDPLLSQ